MTITAFCLGREEGSGEVPAQPCRPCHAMPAVESRRQAGVLEKGRYKRRFEELLGECMKATTRWFGVNATEKE